MSNLVLRNIKIQIEKKVYNKSESYISKSELILIKDDTNLLNYIKLMIKMVNIKEYKLIKDISEMILEKSIKGDERDIRMIINDYNKNVKRYKKHMYILCKKGNMGKRVIIINENLIKEKDIDKNVLRYILHILYNENVISNKDIIEWYNNVEEGSIYLSSNILKEFVEWLRSSSESSSSSDKDSSESSSSDIDSE